MRKVAITDSQQAIRDTATTAARTAWRSALVVGVPVSVSVATASQWLLDDGVSRTATRNFTRAVASSTSEVATCADRALDSSGTVVVQK